MCSSCKVDFFSIDHHSLHRDMCKIVFQQMYFYLIIQFLSLQGKVSYKQKLMVICESILLSKTRNSRSHKDRISSIGLWLDFNYRI